MKPLYNTSIQIFISPLCRLYLQKVLLIHLKKCVFYIIHKLKLPLRVSFKANFAARCLNRFSETRPHKINVSNADSDIGNFRLYLFYLLNSVLQNSSSIKSA